MLQTTCDIHCACQSLFVFEQIEAETERERERERERGGGGEGGQRDKQADKVID